MSMKAVVLCGTSLALLLCLGCGGDKGPEIASVEGTITMDGKPLPNAAVLFLPENGRPGGGRTDENGHYVLNFSGGRQGALLGKSKVRITTLSDPSEAEDGTPIPGQKETIPDEYNTQTTLTYEVKDGRNVADFDLKSGGKVTGTNEET